MLGSRERGGGGKEGKKQQQQWRHVRWGFQKSTMNWERSSMLTWMKCLQENVLERPLKISSLELTISCSRFYFLKNKKKGIYHHFFNTDCFGHVAIIIIIIIIIIIMRITTEVVILRWVEYYIFHFSDEGYSFCCRRHVMGWKWRR